MPYKNKADQLAAQRRHYENHPGYYVQRRHQRRLALKAWVSKYKAERGCSRCPETHPACLDFHHLDGDEKEDCIGAMLHETKTRAAIIAEIEKCEILCSNCHRKLHFDERQTQAA